MNAKDLANHSAQLSPEDRFQLIMAAGSRGDESEVDRLMHAGKSIHITLPDYAPYALAFHELLLLTYIDLLEDATSYDDLCARRDRELRDSIQPATKPKRNKATSPRTKDGKLQGDAVEWPAWHLTSRMAYGIGFQLKAQMEGWMLFCARLNVSPVASWEEMKLPGQYRIRRALTLTRIARGVQSCGQVCALVCEGQANICDLVT